MFAFSELLYVTLEYPTDVVVVALRLQMEQDITKMRGAVAALQRLLAAGCDQPDGSSSAADTALSQQHDEHEPEVYHQRASQHQLSELPTSERKVLEKGR